MNRLSLFIILLCSFASAETDLSSGSLGGYFNYTEIVALLDEYVSKHGDLASKLKLADSALNNKIEYLKVSSKSGLPASEKKSLIISGGLYGGSPISASAVIYAIDRLFEDEQLLNKIDVYFIPVVNVDAYLKAEEEFTSNGTFTAIYKNSKADTCANDTSESGVNLDRNFNANWGSSSEGSSDDGCSNYYRGATYLSESESLKLNELIESVDPTVLIHLEGNGDIIYLPNKSAKISPTEFIESLNDTAKESFYNGVLNHKELNLQTLYSKSGDVSDGSLVESAFLNGALALEISLGSGEERGDSITKAIEQISDILRDVYLDTNYKLSIDHRVYEHECGMHYNCTMTNGFSYFLYEIIVENMSPISSPDLTLDYSFWRETNEIAYDFTLTKVYLQNYELPHEHDHNGDEYLDTELPFIPEILEPYINTTVNFAAAGHKSYFVTFLIERAVSSNETADLTTWFNANVYPTSVTSNLGDLQQDLKQVEVTVMETIEEDHSNDGMDNNDEMDHNGTGTMMFIMVGGIILATVLIIFGVIMYFCVYKKKKKQDFRGSINIPQGFGPSVPSFQPQNAPGVEARV